MFCVLAIIFGEDGAYYLEKVTMVLNYNDIFINNSLVHFKYAMTHFSLNNREAQRGDEEAEDDPGEDGHRRASRSGPCY
mgnify:CR=1 FL=1